MIVRSVESHKFTAELLKGDFGELGQTMTVFELSAARQDMAMTDRPKSAALRAFIEDIGKPCAVPALALVILVAVILFSLIKRGEL